MIQLNVGFKKRLFGFPVIRERPLWFSFNLAALEYATEDIMKIELSELGVVDSEYDLNVAILYAGYYIAAIKGKQKLKYKFLDAVYWLEHMNKTEMEKFAGELNKLIGKTKKVGKQKTGKGEKKKLAGKA